MVATEYSESNPSVSADDRLLAFTSNESGRSEVYVRALAGGSLQRVSLGGGTLTRWSHSGKELFYVNADTLFAVDVRASTELRVGEAKPVLMSRSLGQGFAIMPGDSSFIIAARPRARHVDVVLNLAAELDRLFKRR